MIITNSPLLSRLFIYKDPGWTTAHPLGGGGRREEVLSWDKDTTDTTEIINWLSRASLTGREVDVGVEGVEGVEGVSIKPGTISLNPINFSCKLNWSGRLISYLKEWLPCAAVDANPPNKM